MRWLISTAALGAVLLAGCGSEPRLSASGASAMHREVDAVRSAAESGDRQGALEALDRLRARVREEQDAGRLADADATGLRRGITRARRSVEREVAAPQPTAEPTATAEPVAPPASEEEGDEEGQGNGKSEGKGKSDDKGKSEDKGKSDEKGDE